jgi:hypothetical protein
MEWRGNKWSRDNSGRNNFILLRYSELVTSRNTASDKHITTYLGIQTGTLNMEAEYSTERLLLTHQSTVLCHNSQDCSMNLHSLKSLKTHAAQILSWRLSDTSWSHRHTRSSKTHSSLHLGNQLQFSMSKFMTTNDSRWKLIFSACTRLGQLLD